MVLASFDFGVTWDEQSRHKNGELVWEYYSGLRGGESWGETGYLYGGLFDTIAVAVEKVLPGNRYVLRHAVNAVFGWVGIVYCGLLAGRLFGAWSGVLALILLATSPRFFADSMNNPKDLPFAAMTVMALYYMSTISPRWPYISRSTGIMLAVSLALALNIRAAALVYLGYAGLLVAAYVVAQRRMDWRRLAGTAARLAALAVAVLLLGTVFWPWAQQAPLTRPIQAFLGNVNFDWAGGALFQGRDYGNEKLPWYYVPWWFLISTPPVVLGGVTLSMFFWWNRSTVLRKLALWGIAILPVAAAILMGSTLYDGIRHFEFVYPILVVLAASGWTAVLLARDRPWLRRGAAAALVVGLASILAFDVRFHPNQGVYFNTLVGGPRGAYARYDMDYWGNSVLQAVEWSREVARSSGVAVTVSGNPEHLVMLNAERFPELSFTLARRRRSYLFIRLARGPVAGLEELAGQPALYQVRTPDGALLCSVIPGPAFGELEELKARAAARTAFGKADR
jgi:hypothetical protein